MGFRINEVQRSLRGADYPMRGKDLAELAKRNGADQELVEALARINREVPSPTVVMEELKGSLSGRAPGPRKSDEHTDKDVKGPRFRVTEVQRHLKGAEYPMTGAQLAELARRNGAGDDLVEVLRGVGEVDGPNEVMRQLRDHLGGESADD